MGFFKKLFGKKNETCYLSEEEMTAITDHFDRHVGETTDVFHELVSDAVHIDVHTIPDVPGRDFKVLFTTGMSALPMPNVDPQHSYAELFILLPKDGPMDQESFADQANFWPIQFLKTMARVPTDYQAPIKPGMSMPNGDPAQEFPGTHFRGVMIGRPNMFPLEFSPARIGDKTINFYPVVPMTQAEMDWKIQQVEGTALLDRYDRAGIDPLKVALIDRTRADLA